jgi:hypothetical protein
VKNTFACDRSADLDTGDRDAPHARVLDLVAQQFGQLALDLLSDALRALRMPLHRFAPAAAARVRYSVRETSTIS